MKPNTNPITWLPFPSVVLTSSCLRDEDLEYARHSAHRVLEALVLKEPFDHPCIRLWHDYPRRLISYAYTLNLEWRHRGHEDRFTDLIATLQKQCSAGQKEDSPWWWFLPALTQSHRTSLSARDPAHYKMWFPRPSPPVTMFWPVGPHLTPMPF